MPRFRKGCASRVGITDGVVRFSVGVEAIEDLIADVEQALRGGGVHVNV